MSRYLVAVILFAAGGVILLAFSCEPFEEPSYTLNLLDARMNTQTVQLTDSEGPISYSLARFSCEGLAGGGDGVIVEKMFTGDFLVEDTLRPVTVRMDFEDKDTLSSDQPLTYRLLLLNQDRVSILATFTTTPLKGMVFHIPDTVFPEGKRVTLRWDPVADEARYEVRLMTLGTLAPYPQGSRVSSSTIKHSGEDGVVWRIDTTKLAPGTNYILEVKTTHTEGTWVKEIRGSRLFVFQGAGDTDKKEEKNK